MATKSKSELHYLGPTSVKWLREIGVRNQDDLKQRGSIEIYRQLTSNGRRVTLNMIYAIEGALRGTKWDELSPFLRARLRSDAEHALKPRCRWAGTDPLYVRYHDEEWGVPVHDDRKLFEFLILEGTQAGLSWITILRKRDAYREAFENFEPERVARYDRKRLGQLMKNEGIVRNRLKIESAVTNAHAFLAVQKEFGSFDRYLWEFVGRQAVINRRRTHKDVPARTATSDALSKDLAKRGFRFVGSTICYAFMQAVGMVNDHTTDCFRYRELKSPAR